MIFKRETFVNGSSDSIECHVDDRIPDLKEKVMMLEIPLSEQHMRYCGNLATTITCEIRDENVEDSRI